MVTKSISGSMSRFSAKFCFALRAFTPHTLWRSPRKVARELERGGCRLRCAARCLDARFACLVHELVDVAARPPWGRIIW
jgi:hypothetical protein